MRQWAKSGVHNGWGLLGDPWWGKRRRKPPELETGTAFSTDHASSLGLLPGQWLGIIRNAWRPHPSFGLMDGAEGGGWLFSFCFFFSYSAD